MGKKDTREGLTKAERKALEAQEAALVAELNARATKSKGKKAKVKNVEPDLTTLKKKALKQLVADKTNGKPFRKRVKAELARRAESLGKPQNGSDTDVVATPKSEGNKPVKPKPATEPAEPAEPAVDDAERHPHLKHLDRVGELAKVIADPDASKKDRKAAEEELEGYRQATAEREAAKAAEGEGLTDEFVDELKAKVAGKKLAREAGLDPDAVDRDDEDAVKAYNEAVVAVGGPINLITSNAERKREADRLAGDVAASTPGTPSEKIKDGKAAAATLDEKPTKPRKAKADEPVVTFEDGTAVAAPEQVATEVTTENGGREFEVGAARDETAAEDFGKPSEAPQPLTLEESRNGYKIIQLDDEGKPDPRTVRQYTRVTTYIDNLEDKTNLEKWKLRTLLEGVALSDTPDEHGRIEDPAVAKVRDLMHARDLALAKAAKADRKGKLEVGELAQIEAAANKAFKDALNELASNLLELGGVHEKANRGTNLHTLTELYDAEGIAAIDAKLEAGDITPSDHASIVAYGVAMEAAGLKVVASEVVVVNDGTVEPWPDASGEVPILKGTGKPRTRRVGSYAGRFDRIVLAKRPGDQRASRVIADVKSGRLDYGLAKVEQQVAMYADGDAYDLETGERTKHGAIKSWGLVIHLPQGEGTCTIHVLDLNRGRKANALSAMVRAHRAEAGRMQLGPDLAKPDAADEVTA